MSIALSPKIVVLPGGRLPERKTDGAAGYDIYTRAIVSLEMEREKRKTLFDFSPATIADEVRKNVVSESGGLMYRLDPGEMVYLGTGFVLEMPKHISAYVLPRGNSNMKHKLNVFNSLAPIDSDFRGEPVMQIRNEGEKPFFITKHMRICQLKFELVPNIDMVELGSIHHLGRTERQFGQNGSTGQGAEERLKRQADGQLELPIFITVAA